MKVIKKHTLYSHHVKVKIQSCFDQWKTHWKVLDAKVPISKQINIQFSLDKYCLVKFFFEHTSYKKFKKIPFLFILSMVSKNSLDN